MDKQYLVPKNRKKPIQEKLQLEYPKLFFQWDMFANQITKNADLRDFLADKQSNLCPWCGESLINTSFQRQIVIHHLDYKHLCNGPLTKVYRNHKIVEIPNCLSCDNLSKCTARLVVIHNNCNKQINDEQLKSYKINNSSFLSFEEFLKIILPLAQKKIVLGEELSEEEKKELCYRYNNAGDDKSRITSRIKATIKELNSPLLEGDIPSEVKTFISYLYFGVVYSNEKSNAHPSQLHLVQDFLNGCCEIRSWKIIEYINDNYEILYSYFPFLNKINLKNFCVDYETKLQ